MKSLRDDELAGLPPAVTLAGAGLTLAAAMCGALAAVALLPGWLPGLAASWLGPNPTAYWFLSRASALVAFGLLWLSMALGLLITNRMARIWPGGPAACDLHQHTSLLGLAFALFHGLILTGDRYLGYTLAQVLIPFASPGYRPFWVGLGQVAFYLLALISLSFYAIRSLGPRPWRLIHYLSFAMFLLALAHGLASGTDSAAGWAQGMYWLAGGSILFLTIYRALMRGVPAKARRGEALAQAKPSGGSRDY